MKKAVVLLPTYNEKDNIEKFINEVFAEEKHTLDWKLEVLVSDSNSPDGTLELVKSLAKKNPKIHVIEVGPGLGVGIIEGHRYSLTHLKPDALIQLDADGQVDSNVVPKMLKALDQGYNLAIGSRFVEGGKNKLSLMRKLFSYGASLVYRVCVGPYSIKEVTNSARAFTPELFQRIDLNLVPWREKSFIIQPAFLHAAVVAGAKYKEVPLVFKNRAEGYSKNKVFNYTYDVFTYSFDVLLHRLGLNIPFWKMTRKAKTLVKFGLVGFAGTLIDFIFYKLFIKLFGFPPPTAKIFSTEIAIVNNFLLNNFWTFKYRRTSTNIWQKLGIFNLVSLGGLIIAVGIVKLLYNIYGNGFVEIGSLKLAYNNFFFFATIPPVLIWNFTMNHFITWKNQKED